MKRDFFVFGGISSLDYMMTISEPAVFDKPVRDVEEIVVPGRSGSLVIDNGRYNNVSVTYKGQITREFASRYDSLINKLTSLKGYHRLEDTIHQDVFRMARYETGQQATLLRMFSAGSLDIKFSAKPQRYLKTGEMPIEFTADGIVPNSTDMTALPLIRVYGTGVLGFGSETITITSADEYTDIDCDAQEAFKGPVNCNGNIELSSGEFPELPPGGAGISIGTGITKVIVWPRWWIL